MIRLCEAIALGHCKADIEIDSRILFSLPAITLLATLNSPPNACICSGNKLPVQVSVFIASVTADLPGLSCKLEVITANSSHCLTLQLGLRFVPKYFQSREASV